MACVVAQLIITFLGEVALLLAYVSLEMQYRDTMVEFEDGGESTNLMIAGGVMVGVGMLVVGAGDGKGMPELRTWELAHTEEEAAQLAKAAMNEIDGRIPMFRNP